MLVLFTRLYRDAHSTKHKIQRNIGAMPSLNFCWGTGYPEREVPWFLCLMPNRPSY